MPGQPLSSVIKKRTALWVGSHAARENPGLIALVAEAFAIASEIEAQFSGLLVTMIGAANAGHAVAMLQALTSTSAQSAAIGAVAARMDPPWNTIYEVVARKSATALKDRHRFAHWARGSCKGCPDAMTFIDPEALIEHDIAVGQMMHPPDGRGLLWDKINLKRVLAYRKGDLGRVVRAMAEARDNVSLLRLGRFIPTWPD